MQTFYRFPFADVAFSFLLTSILFCFLQYHYKILRLFSCNITKCGKAQYFGKILYFNRSFSLYRQSLSIEGLICPVILNTHFSQKVSSASKPDDMSLPKIWLSAERRLPYFLGQIFGLLDECKTKSEGRAKQVCTYRHCPDCIYSWKLRRNWIMPLQLREKNWIGQKNLHLIT